MKENDGKRIEQELINRTGKISKQWGFGESAGKVWATLLFSGQPLSQKSIAKKTGYSLGHVSPSLKILEKTNMVRVTRGHGKERLYDPAISFNEAFRMTMIDTLERDIKPLIEQLEKRNDIKDPVMRAKFSKTIKDYKNLEKRLKIFSKIMVVDEATANKVADMLD